MNEWQKKEFNGNQFRRWLVVIDSHLFASAQMSKLVTLIFNLDADKIFQKWEKMLTFNLSCEPTSCTERSKY